MSDWKTNWTDGDTVHSADINRIEANGKANEEAIEAINVKLSGSADANHTHTLDAISETSNKKIMTAAERTKLANIAEDANNYVHPAYTPKTSGLYKVTVDNTGHVVAVTPVTKSDITALGIPAENTNTTYSNATDSSSGLMSSTDKKKLDGIDEGANNYTHPNHLSRSSGLYSIQVDTYGHVVAATKVSKSTITNLGIPGQDTTYSDATTSKSGLMSASDKSKLDGIDADINKRTGRSTIGETFTPTYGGGSFTAGKCAEIFNDYRARTFNGETPKEGNVATGQYSHAEGLATTATGAAAHAEGKSNIASADYAHAEGNLTTASGVGSHAEGGVTTASGKAGHAEGYYSTASGEYSHAEGNGATASGANSHAGGNGSTASGNASFAHGYQCEAKTAVSAAFGEKTIANGYQFVVGQMNIESLGVGVGSQADGDNVFIVGNGTASTRSNAFRVTASGKCYNNGGSVSSGADFAEYFEWLDGNPNNEDRRGRFVTLDGEKIRFATSDDADYILGVVSSVAAVIGNAAGDDWKGKYLTDVFGSRIYQDVEIPESVDEETGEIIPAHTVKQWILNPDYNPEEEYISREFRKEWAPVGMLGQIVVVDDGTCQVNGYCAPSEDGIATASESGYRVMKRIDDNHVKILVK